MISYSDKITKTLHYVTDFLSCKSNWWDHQLIARGNNSCYLNEVFNVHKDHLKTGSMKF